MTKNYQELENIKFNLQNRRREIQNEIFEKRHACDCIVEEMENVVISGGNPQQLLQDLRLHNEEIELLEKTIKRMSSADFGDEFARNDSKCVELMRKIKENNSSEIKNLQHDYSEKLEEIREKYSETLNLIKQLGEIYKQGKSLHSELLAVRSIQKDKVFPRMLEPELYLDTKRGFLFEELSTNKILNMLR